MLRGKELLDARVVGLGLASLLLAADNSRGLDESASKRDIDAKLHQITADI